MKCDHIRTRMQGGTPFFPNMLNNGKVEVCLKEDVDAVIDELKTEHHRERHEYIEMVAQLRRENADAYFAERLAEKDKEIAELKEKLQDHCIHCPVKEQEYDVVAEKDKEIVKLKAENKLLKEHIANGDVSRITWIDEVVELKQKLESVQVYLKSEADKVIADLEESHKKEVERRLENAESTAREQDNHHYYKIFAEGVKNLLEKIREKA